MSSFVVSARKYRPQRFEDVIGQNHIAGTLKNALQTNKLAHSFLFCGPRGVGKTTCARILAKVINCQNPINKVEPCNECSSCKSFNENASFNILELDAASNNSVEHIRTLIEQVRFQPQQGTHKVFIIDEVHMLSTQAFNAFLKTLEEPPPYAIFILATTEKHKILPTILSRCQIFDFKRIQPTDIVAQLDIILKEQKRTADPEALYQIGVKADGAMRDALSIYDKIASATEGHITYKDVTSNLNILDYDYFFRITDTFIRSDLSSAILVFDEVIKQGFEPDLFISGLCDHFRTLLLSKNPTTTAILDFSNELKQRYYNQATICPESLLLSGLSILNQCDIFIPRATNKRLHAEVALMKLCHFSNLSETNVLENSGEKKKVMT
jgi:DNA polymerase-3 subunit gamma/tau